MVTAEIPQSDLFESVAMLKFSVYRSYKKIGCKIKFPFCKIEPRRERTVMLHGWNNSLST